MSAHHRQPRLPARRVLCWGLLAFCLLEAGLGLVLDFGLPTARDPEYVVRERLLRARLAEAPGRPLVLLLGSSRTMLGIQAGRIAAGDPSGPVVFNFGLLGAGPVLEGVCLRRLLAAGIRPDLVFIEVLPPALNEPRDYCLEENWLSGKRLSAPEAAAVWRYHSDPAHLLGQWCQARCVPSRYLPALALALGLDWSRSKKGTPGVAVTTDGHGWHAQPLRGMDAGQRRTFTGLARRQYREFFGPFRLAEGPARALEDLLDRCRAESIPAALVLMPEGKTFQALYPPDMRRGIDAFLAGLSRDRGVPLIDARDWVEDAGFWDSHHLLPEGAAAFTARFEREALRPLLAQLAEGTASGGACPRRLERRTAGASPAR
jgi:hypothetical protein